MKRGFAVAAIMAFPLLGGCSFMRGNVESNFACTAAGGICAPTSKIDDQALALIAQGEEGVASKAASGGTHSPRAMKIVLPARQDRFGRWREASVVYAEPLDAPLSPQVPESLLKSGDVPLADLVLSAPALGAIAEGGTAAPIGNASASPQTEQGSTAQPTTPEAIAAEVRRRLAGAKARASAATDKPASAPAAPSKDVRSSPSAPPFPASETPESN